jgi:hypothetical protein
VLLLAALLNRSALPKLSRPPELPATKLNRSVKPLVSPLTLSDVSIVTPATSRSSVLPEIGVTVPVLAGTLEAPLLDAVPSSGETEASPLYSKICSPIVVGLVVAVTPVASDGPATR